MKRKTKKTITLNLYKEDYEKLKEISIKKDEPISMIVRKLIEKYIEDNKQ